MSTLSRTIIYEKVFNKRENGLFEFCKLKKIAQSYKCFQRLITQNLLFFKNISKQCVYQGNQINNNCISIHVYYCI